MASSNTLSVTQRESSSPLSESLHYKPTPSCTISFRQPSYPDGQGILLTLYSFDYVEGGLHYRTAFLVCAIVVVSAFDG